MTLDFLKRGTSENFLFTQIVKKNFSSKYKDSALGILWSVLRPLLYMVMMTVIFSTIFKRINNFAVYFLSGYCIYAFFVAGTTISMNSLKSNKPVLEKVHVSRYIFAIGGIASEFINFIIMIILLVVIMFVTKAPYYTTAFYGIVPVIILVFTIIGVGLILAILNAYFSDTAHLYSIFTIFLMYASAVFVPMESIPKWASQYLELNPLYQLIFQFREVIMYGHQLPMQSVIYTIICAVILLLIGILLFRKYQDLAIFKL